MTQARAIPFSIISTSMFLLTLCYLVIRFAYWIVFFVVVVVVYRSTEQVNFEELISTRLKSIMMSLDLEQVTSKEVFKSMQCSRDFPSMIHLSNTFFCFEQIRSKLESHFHHDLTDYKSYIDREMIRIMGQMEQASKILDYLYLGSEWNASNFEELKGKG